MEKMGVNQELPGVLVVIFIAGGILAFLVVFIFGKRQIQRFTLKNQKGPHVPVGTDANKALKREIERRLDRTLDISIEPYLVSPHLTESRPYFYRMKAVDDAKHLEMEILECAGVRRQQTDTMRRFLMSLRNGVLSAAGPRVINEFCDMYELARYGPAPFWRPQHVQMASLQQRLLDSVHSHSGRSSRRSTPRRLSGGAGSTESPPPPVQVVLRRPHTLPVTEAHV